MGLGGGKCAQNRLFLCCSTCKLISVEWTSKDPKRGGGGFVILDLFSPVVRIRGLWSGYESGQNPDPFKNVLKL